MPALYKTKHLPKYEEIIGTELSVYWEKHTYNCRIHDASRVHNLPSSSPRSVKPLELVEPGIPTGESLNVQKPSSSPSPIELVEPGDPQSESLNVQMDEKRYAIENVVEVMVIKVCQICPSTTFSEIL